MNMCINHNSRQAVSKCTKCGNDICAECLVDLNNNNIICKSCIEASVFSREKKHTFPSDKTYAYPVDMNKNFNGLLLFIFSMLPGAGHMYLGLIKKGLVIMSSFFMTIYFLALLSSNITKVIFAFLIPIIWFSSFFDGFNIRRKLNAGEYVPDSCDTLVRTFSSNKYTILSSAILIVLIEFIFSRRHIRLYSFSTPVLIIVLGIFLIVNSKKR